MNKILEFIRNKIDEPIKTILKSSSIDITIQYLFNGRYNNGLVNFVRAYDLMKHHCKMQLIHSEKFPKPSTMVAVVSPGLNINFEPLFIKSNFLNTFCLEEVMRFVQSA